MTRTLLGFFLTALAAQAESASHVILLGDLFEAWPGDDQTDRIASELVAAVTQMGHAGKPVSVMRGNRDFLLDIPFESSTASRFAKQTGATLLDDPTLLGIAEYRVLLLHGDTLCTDDTAYQEFRRENRSKQWQQAFLSQPLAERMAIAKHLREQSEARKRDADIQIMDVSQADVDLALDDAGTAQMLHGHTHRPNTHRWHHLGQSRVRFVLPDWDAQEPRGGFMRVDRSGITPLGLGDA